MGILAPQVRQQFQAAHAGQPQIGEDNIGAIRQTHRIFHVAGLLHFKPGAFQLQLHHAPQFLLVFHY